MNLRNVLSKSRVQCTTNELNFKLMHLCNSIPDLFKWIQLNSRACVRNPIQQKHLGCGKRRAQESASYWTTERCDITVRPKYVD